ncbi:hypothetical protein [Paenibacillus periandrae]|uniref:hypothetical protein n=1 Tax=Paenibacillus periandrae TaxID=1761741 RepID=UPI001F08E744|nr:hypothetical protein [Paenibacillus periandrae]
MSKIYSLISLIYFWGICWIVSLFPKIFILVMMQNKELDKLWYWLITFGTALVLLSKFRRKWNQPLASEDNEVPLFELYPSLKDEILQLVQKLDIKQDIRFYTNDFQGINGKARSNKSYASVTLSRGLLQLETQDINVILLHELFHVKHWTIHFINFEFASMLEEMNLKMRKYHEKRKRKLLYRYFQIDYFLQTLSYFSTMFLLFLNMITNMFRMIFDESMADKFAIDWNKSLRIVNVLKKSKHTNGRINKISDDFRFSQHLDIDIRCWLLSKYYYLKYVRPKWNTTKIIIISTTLLLFITYFYYMPYLLRDMQIFLDIGAEKLKKLWISLFNDDDNLAKTVFVLIISSVSFVWIFIKLIILWSLGARWKIRLRYFSYLAILGMIITTFTNTLISLPPGLILTNAIFVVLLGSSAYKQ